ncbi:MAG: DUF4190 domain-containing protein [Bacteroidia bacterium]|nr:DUF4190 domain-containing protein [Bacteroidia bacterium]
MKTIIYISFIGLCITLLLSSCTVEKRLYSSGYHIEWFTGIKKAEKNKIPNSVQALVINDTSKVTESDAIQASINNPENVTASASTDHSPLLNLPNVTQNKWHNNNSSKVINTKGTSTIISLGNRVAETEPKLNWKALVSFIVGFAIIILAFTGINSTVIAVSVILGLISVVFGIIGLNQINKYPNKWNGRFFAMAGIVIGFSIVLMVAFFGLIIAGYALS